MTHNKIMAHSLCYLAFLIFSLKIASAQAWFFQEKFFAVDSIEEQDHFGNSVALSDSYLLVGAPWHSLDSVGQNRIFSAGAAYIYQKDGNGDWTFLQKILSPDRHSVGIFGENVAINDKWAAIGTYFARNDTIDGVNSVGAVYMYRLSAATGLWELDTTILASDPVAAAHFGYSMSLDGERLLVGADQVKTNENGQDTLIDAGAAYIYEYQAGQGWKFVQKLVASDRIENAHFGQAVALDGDYAVIGSPIYEIPPYWFDAGQVYVFGRDPASNLWTEVQIIQDEQIGFYDFFGQYLSISGDYFMVGKPRESDFKDKAPETEPGVVSVYHRENSGQWILSQELLASDYDRQDKFGFVEMEGEIAMVGATQEDHVGWGLDSIEAAGSVYVFELQGNGQWKEVRKLTAPDRQLGDGFGFSIDLNGQEVAMGLPYGANGDYYDAGSAYVFEREWTVGVEEIVAQPIFQLVSNPAETLEIKSHSPDFQMISLEIFSIQGSRLFGTKTKFQSEWRRSFPELSAGLYLVRISSEGEQSLVLKWRKR